MHRLISYLKQRVHPSSIAGRVGRGHWFPLLNLVWLFWVFVAPWYVETRGTRMVLLTYLSVPVFLVPYFRAWYGDRRHLIPNTVLIAALGLVMIPVNASWSYVIYAAVLVPHCTRTVIRSLPWLAALMLAVYADATASGFPQVASLGCILTSTTLAMINLVARVYAQRDAELRLSHEEVRRLAAMAERERIGRDLHDLLGHTLSLIAIKSELARRLFDRDGAAARNEIVEIERVAREALAQVRGAVSGIRAAGLAPELASARLVLGSAGITIDYQRSECDLSAPAETVLALGLRESVTNVLRHSGASRISVCLSRDSEFAVLSISDDGRGGDIQRGNGLNGMAERLSALGGDLQIGPARPRGTQLCLRVPRLAQGRSVSGAVAGGSIDELNDERQTRPVAA